MICQCSRCGDLSQSHVTPGAYGIWQCEKCRRLPPKQTGHCYTVGFTAGHGQDWSGARALARVRKRCGFGVLAQ